MGQIERTPPRDGLAIRTACPACGRVEFPIRNIHLWMEDDGRNTYSFICPRCSGLARTPADAGTVGLLLVTSPPLQHEDLHSFKRELERDDWFHRFERRFGDKVRIHRGSRTHRPRQRWSWVARILKGEGQRHRLLSS